MKHALPSQNSPGFYFIQLGGYNEIINLLPVLYEQWREGRKATLVVCEAFAGLLDAVNYVGVRRFTGQPHEVVRARYELVASGVAPHRIKVAQADFTRLELFGDNYEVAQWQRAGFAHRWEQCALVFNNRDIAAEEEFVAGEDVKNWKDVLVMSLRTAPHIVNRIREEFADWRIVDVTNCQNMDRPQNILGLLDSAACLISDDSVALHLAAATGCPVVSIVDNDPWKTPARRANHFVRLHFNQLNDETLSLIFSSIRACATRSTAKVVHVVPEWNMSEADRKRWKLAEWSWTREAASSISGWENLPAHYNTMPRTSVTQFGDARSVPFVKDMVEAGFATGADAVVLSNSDVGWAVSGCAALKVRQALERQGAAYCWRFDFERIPQPLDHGQTVSGLHIGGLDLFAFSRSWWEKYRDQLPDCVMGCADWDLMYRDLVRVFGGAELYGLIWHELHPSVWQKQGVENRGNDHNRKLFAEHHKKVDTRNPYRNLREFIA